MYVARSAASNKIANLTTATAGWSRWEKGSGDRVACTYLWQRRDCATFIVSMQRHDGSLFSKRVPPVGGKESLYYPGEAALGLIDLYELDH